MTDQSRTKFRWQQIGFPVSILLNLFLLAVIGGHLWYEHVPRSLSESPFARALADAQANLPRAEAVAFGRIMRDDRPKYDEAAQQALAARQELNSQITADQFNEAETEQALAKWRAASSRFMDEFSGTLIKALAQLSLESRRKLVAERQSVHSRSVVP